MTISPVIYGELDPYEDSKDHNLMILTQLAQSIVMFCGIVIQTVKGDEAMWIVTAISLITLVPMLFGLVLFILDPRYKFIVFLPSVILVDRLFLLYA
jgi:hypothetical protein